MILWLSIVEEDKRILATGFDCRQKPLCDANAVCTTDQLNRDRHVCVCNNGFQGNGSLCHGKSSDFAGQIKPRDQVQFKLKHGSSTMHPRIRTNEWTTLLTCQNLLVGHKYHTNRGYLVSKIYLISLRLNLIIFTINIHYKITLITLNIIYNNE